MPSNPCRAAGFAAAVATLPSLGKEVAPPLEIWRTEPVADWLVVAPVPDVFTISSTSCSAIFLTAIATDSRVRDSSLSQIARAALPSVIILRCSDPRRSQRPNFDLSIAFLSLGDAFRTVQAVVKPA